MTPKEKAKELVDKYSFALMPLFTWGYNEQLSKGDLLRKAKQCATIAVDEILYCPNFHDGYITCDQTYWEEVKLEIQNYQP